MEIFVNNICITVFEGARTVDAIRSYYRILQQPVPESFPVIFDSYGNTLEPDGALTSQNRIFIPDKLNTQTND